LRRKSQTKKPDEVRAKSSYSMILATTPAPTVLPPHAPQSAALFIAIGAISATVIWMLSPGITISVPRNSIDRSHPWCGNKTVAGTIKNGVCAALFLAQHIHLAVNFVCGVIDPGLASTAPLDSSRFVPRSSTPRCRPPAPGPAACGTSPPVADRLDRRPYPTISISSPTFTIPAPPARSPPCAPGDRKHVLNRHQKRLVDRRSGVGIKLSAHRQLHDRPSPSRLVASSASLAEPFTIACRRPETRTSTAAPHLQLHQLQQLRIVDHVALVHVHDHVRHPTWRASNMCSRVCGIGPSPRSPPKWPIHLRRPVIMFFT